MNELPMVKFSQVSKIYPGGIVALKDINFTISEGEFVFIVGPSGAGKTTVVRLLIREEMPTAGDIHFEDIEVHKIPRKLLSVYRQQLGVVFQDLKLIDTKTVKENIELALEISSKTRKEMEETTDYLLNLVNLKGRAHLFPEELSGGEKQRVAIARALANEPKLFIADEPTGNLDPATAMEILNILKTVNNLGTTVVLITHDDDIVDLMQTRVLHMQDGKVVSDEKGGYFKKQEPKKEVKAEVEQTPKADGKDAKQESELKKFGLKKGVLKKLGKARIDSMELLLNCSEEDLEKIGLKENEIEAISNAVENYLQSK
jgi:cell division transport system ATP-binding protein